MPGDGRIRPQGERCRRTIPRQAWLATKKNSLNEEDIPLFTHRRCLIGERRSSLALRSGWHHPASAYRRNEMIFRTRSSMTDFPGAVVAPYLAGPELRSP